MAIRSVRRLPRRSLRSAAVRPRCVHQCNQRVFLAMRHPDFRRARRRDRRGEAIPVGMVGDHQRQLDAALARPGTQAHPARR
jgi:hypothetical protein